MSFDNIDTPVSDAELLGEEPQESPVEPEVAEAPSPEPEQAQPEAEEPQQERSPVIPRARFDEVNAKLHAEREENERLRREIEQSKPQAPQPGEVDIDELEDRIFDLMMEGDKAGVKELRAQINAELVARAERSAAAKLTTELSQREQETALQSVAQSVIQAYPFLDHTGAAANKQAIDDVVEWRDFYVAKGDSLPVALQKAAEKVGPMYANADPAAVPLDTRKAAALSRNAQAANAQPPATVAGIGNRAAPSVPKIETQQDWESLSQSERDRLLMEM